MARGRTIEMVSVPSNRSSMRPAGKLLVKERSRDSPRGRSLIVLPDGRVLDAQGERHDCVTYVRAANTLAALSAHNGIAPPIAARPGQPHVLCSRETGHSSPAQPPQIWHGCDVRLMDLDNGRELDRYPLQAPFVWLDGDRFLCRSMGFYCGKRALDPYFEARHKQIQDQFTDDEADGFAEVSVSSGKGELRARCGVYQAWSRIRHLAVSGDIALYGGFLTVGAARLPAWTPIWSTEVPSHGLGYSMRQAALSVDGKYFAVVAGGTDRKRDLVVFAVETGEEIVCMPLSKIAVASGLIPSATTEVTCVAWHPSGWLAVGTRTGVVAHVRLTQEVDMYRASPRGIEALAFTNDASTLLVASKAGIGAFPLVDSERA